MTISQLIQTISLGNFTYFMRFHGHFPHFLHKPWRIITGTAWQTADNRHWEGGALGEGRWPRTHWSGNVVRVLFVRAVFSRWHPAQSHFVPRKRFRRYKEFILMSIVPSETFYWNQITNHAWQSRRASLLWRQWKYRIHFCRSQVQPSPYLFIRRAELETKTPDKSSSLRRHNLLWGQTKPVSQVLAYRYANKDRHE